MDTYVQATDPVVMLQAVVEMAAMFNIITPLAFNLNEAGHQRHYRKATKADPDALQIPIDPSWITEPRDDEPQDGDDVNVAPDPESLDDLTEEEVEHIFEVLAATLSPETLIKIQFVMPPTEGGEAGEGEGGGSPSPSRPQEPKSEGDDASEDKDADNSGEGSKGKQDNDLDNKDSKGEDEGDNGKAKGDNVPDAAGGSSGTHTSDDEGIESPTGSKDEALTNDMLQEAQAEAEAERMKDTALDQDVQAFHNSKDDAASKLDIYTGGQSSDARRLPRRATWPTTCSARLRRRRRRTLRHGTKSSAVGSSTSCATRPVSLATWSSSGAGWTMVRPVTTSPSACCWTTAAPWAG